METTLADRIRLRLQATGKSAATASTQAGLGRSAVQNILRGASESPRLSTLEALTVSLDCSLEYLIGKTEEPGKHDWSDIEVLAPTSKYARAMEVGVYRSNHPPIELTDEMPVHLIGMQRMWWSAELLVMNDDSMAGAGLLRGDILTSLAPGGRDYIELSDGMIVAVIHTLVAANVTELSLRRVQRSGKVVRLLTEPLTGKAAVLEISAEPRRDATGEDGNVYETGEGAVTTIIGIVTHVQRRVGELPSPENFF